MNLKNRWQELNVLIYILLIEGRKKGHVFQVHQDSNADVVCPCQFKHSCMTSSRHFSQSFFFIFTKFGVPKFFDRDHCEVLGMTFFFNLLFTIFNWTILFLFGHLYPFQICYLWSLWAFICTFIPLFVYDFNFQVFLLFWFLSRFCYFHSSNCFHFFFPGKKHSTLFMNGHSYLEKHALFLYSFFSIAV